MVVGGFGSFVSGLVDIFWWLVALAFFVVSGLVGFRGSVAGS